jgi:hypothetical protein
VAEKTQRRERKETFGGRQRVERPGGDQPVQEASENSRALRMRQKARWRSAAAINASRSIFALA